MHTITTSIRPVFFTASLLLTACGDDGGSTQPDTETGGETTGGGTTTLPTGTETSISSTDPTDGTSTTTTETDESSSSSSSDDTGPEATLLERVLAAIGGQAELDALSGVRITASSSRYAPGEAFTPTDPYVHACDQDTTVSLDIDTGSVRNEIERTLFYLPAPGPLQITEIAQAGEGGWIAGNESFFGGPPAIDMLSDRYASTLRQAELLNPHVLLARLSLDPSGASESGTADFEGTTYELLEIDDDVHPITLWVDPATDLVRRLTTLENSHLVRDVEIEVRYADWQATPSGILFPGQAQLLFAGEVLLDETRSAFDTDPGFDDETFALPPEAAPALDPAEVDRGRRSHQHNQIWSTVGVPTDGLQLVIVADEPVPGVHVLSGGSHHSIVVEQEAGLVLIEAPLYPERCEAILDWAQTELPGQSFTHVVVSHHHHDHAACARVIVAAGATLVIDEVTEAYFAEVLAAPSTIEPDALADNPVDDPPILSMPEGGSVTIDDPTRPVVVYDVANTHASDLVLPFLPAEGVVFVTDLYNPGFPSGDPTGPAALLDAFALHGITDDVQLVVGSHGFGYATLADLETAAGGG